MATPIYSQRFIAIQGLGGASPIVTVPDGEVWIVKQLTFYSDPTLATVYGRFKDPSVGATLFAAASGTSSLGTPLPTWAGFYGAIVFNPGQQLQWETSSSLGDTADVYAGGYVLTVD